MRSLSHKITLVFACLLFAPLLASAQGDRPAAVLSETHFRFGTAVEAETVRHDFILFNKGSTDLTIEKIKTG